jgi:hypothetical protein
MRNRKRAEGWLSKITGSTGRKSSRRVKMKRETTKMGKKREMT